MRDVRLHTADDETIWEHAAGNGLVIVSKDSDFHQRSFVFGHPQKVIWIRRGTCSTNEIESRLRSRHSDLIAFESDKSNSFLALG